MFVLTMYFILQHLIALPPTGGFSYLYTYGPPVLTPTIHPPHVPLVRIFPMDTGVDYSDRDCVYNESYSSNSSDQEDSLPGDDKGHTTTVPDLLQQHCDDTDDVTTIIRPEVTVPSLKSVTINNDTPQVRQLNASEPYIYVQGQSSTLTGPTYTTTALAATYLTTTSPPRTSVRGHKSRDNTGNQHLCASGINTYDNTESMYPTAAEQLYLFEINDVDSSNITTIHLNIRFFLITDQHGKAYINIESCPTDQMIEDHPSESMLNLTQY